METGTKGIILLMLCFSLSHSEGENLNSETVMAMNRFAIQSLHNLVDNDGANNVFMSPVSIYQCLALLEAGSKGATNTKLKSVLMGKVNGTFPHQIAGDILKDILSSTEGITLSFASRLWTDKPFSIIKEYVKFVRDKYNVKARELNFRKKPEQCRLKINDWVRKTTQNNIKELLSKGMVSSDTQLVLTNAIYFKGTWTSPFDKKLTRKGHFTYFEGKEKKTVKTYFMSKFGHVLYNRLENSDLQAIELPYGSGRFSLAILLPKEESTNKQITLVEMQEALHDMQKIKVQLRLPKFKIDLKYKLQNLLTKMDLGTLFSPEANLSGISEDNLQVSQVIHQATINLDEKGTEASAATAVVLGRSFIPVFNADRSFTFLIRDRKSGVILFIGKLNKPQ